jgi:hypothetical protein
MIGALMLQEVETQAGLPLEATAPGAPSTTRLESALEQLDERLGATARALAAAQKRLKDAVEASRHGNLRDLPGALESLVESSGTLAQTAVNARRSWAFDSHRHLEAGDYVAELLAHAGTDGLAGARDVDGQLYSFPVIVKVDARDLSLKIGKKIHRHLRPSAVVGRLRRMRSQPARDNTRQLVTAFEKAYLAVTGGEDGVAVSLRRIYDLLVLRPGQGREYTELDFMLDVYKVDRAGRQVTPAGRELSLPASTGTKGGKGIRFVGETGEERLYSSIRFDSQVT